MSPEDPKHQINRRNSSAMHEISASSPNGRRLSKNLGTHPYTQQGQLPTLNDLNIATSPAIAPLGASSSSRLPHSYYGASTPPMSPGHALLSPISRPHCGITDPSQYSSSGFYQLPPPLQQSYAPRQSPHHSPAMHPQSGHHSRQGLPPLPPLPSALHSSSSSNGYSSPRGTTTPQMSPLPNHYLVSPGLGPMISPYPTPQHQPRHFPSPHHDPLGHSKGSIPAMILPASALSSSESAPTSGEITATLRSYSTLLTQEERAKETSVFEESHSSISTSTSTSASASAPAPAPAPASARRISMLPPQSTKVTTPYHRRSSRSQTRKSIPGSSGGVGGNTSKAEEGDPFAKTTTTAVTTTTTPTKRRGSSNAKIMDQETRDLMRKVSHSAIERRRRERINDKILQLKHLVPACVDEDHLHKLSILQSTIEYIQHLKAILPASVANTKIGKATNNNPNNKTTDMLEALGGSITTKFPLTPLMTTGLNHIHAKRIKMETQEQLEHASSAATTALSEDDSDHHDDLQHPHDHHHRHHNHQQEHQDHQEHSLLVDSGPGGPLSATSSVSSSASHDFLSRSSSSALSTSSDDDAKDGLLLLAGQSTAAAVVTMDGASPHKRGSRKKAHARPY
ncbi:unnamed protein product [Mortierella alpina]